MPCRPEKWSPEQGPPAQQSVCEAAGGPHGGASNSLRAAAGIEQVKLARRRASELELPNAKGVALRNPGLRSKFAGHQLFHDGERIQLLCPALQMEYSRTRVQRPAVIH